MPMKTTFAGRNPRLNLWVLFAAFSILAACSPHVELYPQLEGLARAGQYRKAAQLVEENKDEYGERNAVLYHLDRGIYFHYAGAYKKSNQAFEAAERQIDYLYTQSVTGNVAAFLVNDNTLPYKGEDFESVVVNLYRSLNYIQLGDVDAALVEARKVNQKLILINSSYDEGKKNEYSEDAFARFLMGALYEMGGTRDDINDAFISNRQAAKIYKTSFSRNYGVGPPSLLGANLLTTATFMGPEEVAEAKKMFPGQEIVGLNKKASQGQIIFVHFAGRSPSKIETAIRALMPDGNRIKIAFPRYKRNFYLIRGSRVLLDGGNTVALETAEPIGAIAIKNLENRRVRIRTKAILRATTKYLTSKIAQKKAREKSQAAGLLAWAAGNVYAEVSEQADLRSWQTLPDQILIGRALVPPGKHAIKVEFTSKTGAVVSSRDLGEVEIKAGQTRFFLLHTLN